MKKLMIVFFVMFCFTAYSQVDTCLTKQQIQKIGMTIGTLAKKVALCDSILVKYSIQEKTYKNLLETDSIIISTQKAELGFLQYSNSHLKLALKKSRKQNKIYISVIATLIVTSLIIWRM